MSRREFPRSVKVARIKAATRDGVVYCEKCSLPCSKWEIHHVDPDALTGEPTFENSALWCIPCHDEETSRLAPVIAKVKRVEAKHVGATRPKGSIQTRPKAEKPKADKLPMPRGPSEIARRYAQRGE